MISVNRKQFISTDLFKNKNIPSCIKDHPLFKNPTKVSKIFPSLGLSNFKEEVKIDKCFVDIKKEGSYVFNLLNAITSRLSRAQEDLQFKADSMQMLLTKDQREQNKDKIVGMFSFSKVINKIMMMSDPTIKENLDGVIRTDQTMIDLKLYENVIEKDPAKPIFKRDERLIKVYNKIKEKCLEYSVNVLEIEQTAEFKVFSKENIPNKELSVIFSSDGETGAWDIATMSVRGIKSCQRWDGEYPSCLVGSILSKFVGIIYLTSGAQAEPYPDAARGGTWKDLGTKMMRRCVVRYAVDADDGQPYILLDKMYPEPDKEVLAVFMNCLQSKTKIKVQNAHEIPPNRLKHMYTPHEKLKDELSGRYLSYHDIALKSEQDFNLSLLNSSREQIERDIKSFKYCLSLNISRSFEKAYISKAAPDALCYSILHNIYVSGGFANMADCIADTTLAFLKAPKRNYAISSQENYKKYLLEFLSQRKSIFDLSKSNLVKQCSYNVSKQYDFTSFIKYIEDIVASVIKTEISNLKN